MRLHRIIALIARHSYLHRRSLPRLMEIFYWPFLDLIIWGFITVYLAQHQSQIPSFFVSLLGALLLWDMLFRSQQAVTLSFLEDLWARNLINLFASPLKLSEFLAAAMLISILKVIAASLAMGLGAALLFSYNVLEIGLWLAPFIVNMVVMGWIIGFLTTAIIMRFGQEVSVLAWSVVFLFQPISCVFYPMDVLPRWLQVLAWANPAAHIFEGMRELLSSAAARPITHLLWAGGLNLVLLIAVLVLFYRTFEYCRKYGLLVRVGE